MQSGLPKYFSILWDIEMVLKGPEQNRSDDRKIALSAKITPLNSCN